MSSRSSVEIWKIMTSHSNIKKYMEGIFTYAVCISSCISAIGSLIALEFKVKQVISGVARYAGLSLLQVTIIKL